MYKKIPQDFITELISFTNLVDLINTKLELKKYGNIFKSICPFHKENNPSFVVNKIQQFYYCFGCHVSGNAIDFLMNYDGLSFIESIKELALINNLEIPYLQNNSKKKSRYLFNKFYKIINKINIIYRQALNNKKYFIANVYLKNRGITKDIIDKFSIGFAPINILIKYFNKSKNNIFLLNKLGMLNKNLYDKFYQRIIFPIRNNNGNVIAFSGRSISNNLPKYLNSNENDFFHKKRILYGMYELNNLFLKKIIIVEGYLDVLTLVQFGINYVVSIMGANISTHQIKMLFRKTNKIICCCDGDKAGRIATWNILKKILPFLIFGKKINFMFLPKGYDPDSFVRKFGKSEFKKYIKKSLSLPKFLFFILIKKVDLSNYQGKIKLIKLILPLINQIPCNIFKLYLRKKLGKKIGILEDVMLEEQIIKNKNIINNKNYSKIKYNIINILIGLLVQNPNLAILVPKNHILYKKSQYSIQIFIKILKICNKYPKINTGKLIEFFRYDICFLEIKNFSIWNHMIEKNMIKNTFVDGLKSLYNLILKNYQNKLIALDRIHKLSKIDRKKIWIINQKLIKK